MSIAFEPGAQVPPWRVGVFVSSSRRPHLVVMVAVGEEQIAEWERHKDFVRWVGTSRNIAALRELRSATLNFRHEVYECAPSLRASNENVNMLSAFLLEAANSLEEIDRVR